MKYYYTIIINGWLQEVLMPCETKQQALNIIEEWFKDGRITINDRVQIKTTIEIIDEIITVVSARN